MREMNVNEMMKINGGGQHVREVYWAKYPNASQIDFTYNPEKQSVFIQVWKNGSKIGTFNEKCASVENGMCFI